MWWFRRFHARSVLIHAQQPGGDLRSIVDGAPEPDWIDPATLPAGVRPLAARFEDAGLDLRLRPITTDLGVPSVLATVSEGGSGRRHTGFGTHPDLEVALGRAITECAQLKLA